MKVAVSSSAGLGGLAVRIIATKSKAASATNSGG